MTLFYDVNSWFEVHNIHRAVMGATCGTAVSDRLVIIRSEEEFRQMQENLSDMTDGEVLYSSGLVYRATGPDEVEQLIDLLTGALIDDEGPREEGHCCIMGEPCSNPDHNIPDECFKCSVYQNVLQRSAEIQKQAQLEAEIEKERDFRKCEEKMIVEEGRVKLCGPRCSECPHYAAAEERCEIRDNIILALNEAAEIERLEGPDYDDPIYQG